MQRFIAATLLAACQQTCQTGLINKDTSFNNRRNIYCKKKMPSSLTTDCFKQWIVEAINLIFMVSFQ